MEAEVQRFIKLTDIRLTSEIEQLLTEKEHFTDWENKCWSIGKLAGLNELTIAAALTDIETEQENLKEQRQPVIQEVVEKSYLIPNKTLDYLIEQIELASDKEYYDTTREFREGVEFAKQVLLKLKAN